MNGERKNLILGKGLIGSHLAAVLEESGEVVSVLTKGDGHDLRSAEQYFDKFEWADRVWFLAWDVGVWRIDVSPSYEREILESNLKLCSSVFSCLEKSGKPFLFTSSQAARSSYMEALAIGKRVGEFFTNSLGGHIARFWNVYGWESPGERSHLIPDLIAAGLRGDISLMTNGEEIRQFLYVRDCAEALIHQFEIGQKEADITSWEWKPVKVIGELIGEKLGVSVTFGSKPGRAPYAEPSIPLESWKPRYSLQSGLDEVMAEAKKHV